MNTLIDEARIIRETDSQPDDDGLSTHVVNVVGRRITCMTAPAIVQRIHQALQGQSRLLVAHYNVHAFNLSTQHPWFFHFLQEADVTHCDGSGLLKAMQYLGLKLPKDYRVSYTVLMPQILALCQKQRYSLFLLGSRPQDLPRAVQEVAQTYPNIRVGGHHGFFDVEDPLMNQEILDQIRDFHPDILLVGMGMPRQEGWIRRYHHRLSAPVVLTGGAIIDRLAGVVPDCPDWLSHHGLEWLYRLCLEPRRLAVRYLVGNPAFLMTMALARLQGVQVKPWLPPTVTDSSKIRAVGHYLVTAGLLSTDEVEQALVDHETLGIPFRDVLAQRQWIQGPILDYLAENLISFHRIA